METELNELQRTNINFIIDRVGEKSPTYVHTQPLSSSRKYLPSEFESDDSSDSRETGDSFVPLFRDVILNTEPLEPRIPAPDHTHTPEYGHLTQKERLMRTWHITSREYDTVQEKARKLGVPLIWHMLCKPRFNSTERTGPLPRLGSAPLNPSKKKRQKINKRIRRCKEDPNLPLPSFASPERAGRPAKHHRLRDVYGSALYRSNRPHDLPSSDSS